MISELPGHADEVCLKSLGCLVFLIIVFGRSIERFTRSTGRQTVHMSPAAPRTAFSSCGDHKKKSRLSNLLLLVLALVLLLLLLLFSPVPVFVMASPTPTPTPCMEEPSPAII